MVDTFERLAGARSTLGMKAPAVTSTTGSITLSGLQTIDGVALAEGDRVLVKGQTDTRQNGIYVAATSGWARALDFDGNTDFTLHTMVYAGGASEYGIYRTVIGSDFEIGVSTVAFTNISAALGNLTFPVSDYGAIGDGLTDDTVAINAAITAANAAGGGVVTLMRAHRVSNVGASSAIIMKSNVTLRGIGRNATTITLAAASDAQVIVATSVSDIVIEDLLVDGNRANQTLLVHGIRLAGVTGCAIRGIKIQNATHYGIGAQDGTLRDILIDDVIIEDVGADGIDIKNRNDDNENIVITNVKVDGWGLNTSLTIQAAIDCRGPCKLSMIEIRNPGHTDVIGVRFRQGLEGQPFPEDLGGRHSQISQFIINLGAPGGTTRIGLQVLSDDVKASQGFINGGQHCVQIAADRFSGHQIRAQNAEDDGFRLAALGVVGTETLDANFASLVSCVAASCTDTGFVIQADNCVLVDCTALFNDDGIDIQSTADNTRIIGGYSISNVSTQLNNGGTNTQITVSGGQNNFFRGDTLTLSHNAAGASGGPNYNLDRVSTAPTANDVLAQITWTGADSALNTGVAYAQIDARILDATDGSEDGELRLRARINNSNTVIASVGNGLQIGTPTGGYPGSGSINVSSGLFVNNIGVLSGGSSPTTANIAAVGSLFLRTNGSSSANRLYVATSTGGAWAFIPTSS